MASLEAWLRIAGIREGAVFRAMTRHNTVRAGRLAPGSVATILKTRLAAGLAARGVPQAEIERMVAQVSAHSLRVTFITEAAHANVTLDRLSAHTRHRKVDTLLGYVRRASASDWTPTHALDLTNPSQGDPVHRTTSAPLGMADGIDHGKGG